MERNMYEALYEASLSGSVPTLNALIQEDPLILDRPNSHITTFIETPLHIAALRGHTHFATVLVRHNPKLAVTLDSFRRTPLHLAAAEGFVGIVQELINVSPNGWHGRDQDGRTPLHLAAMNEQLEVMKLLIKENPELAKDRLGNGETVLHMCVKHNRLESLKLLVDESHDNVLFNAKDDSGDTILHLAVALKQMETIKYLLSISGIYANAVNKNGFTALDVLEYCPRDFIALEIQEILVEAGIRRAKDLGVGSSSSTMTRSAQDQLNTTTNCEPWTITKARHVIVNAIKNQYIQSSHSNWLEEARGNLMVAATVTASMTFQSGLYPPGGVWPKTGQTNIPDVGEGPFYAAGNSIAGTMWSSDYLRFLKYNTVSFVASLSIILLMISGFPLKNKFSMCLLILIMCTTIVFIILTYLESIILVTADQTFEATMRVYKCALGIWIGLCAIVLLHHTMHFLVWLLNKLRGGLLKKY